MCRLWRNLSFPKALWPLVTPTVLVETFEQGQLIHSFVDNPSNPHNAELANIGRDCYLKMLLNDNFIHAGAHSCQAAHVTTQGASAGTHGICMCTSHRRFHCACMHALAFFACLVTRGRHAVHTA